jgi:sulfide:quinone oxidoreductase
MEVLIAGGGVAGLEGLLALHALAGERVRLTLAAPKPAATAAAERGATRAWR